MSKPSDTISDAAPRNWVDLYAPAFTRPYLRLMRADRPIGTWLLLWPGLWGVALAGDPWPSLKLMLLFVVGAFVMRGAGCTYNDIVDRDIDARVERTRLRPIPSGAVSLRGALLFLLLQLFIGLFVLLALNGLAIGLGIASLALIAIYPFMKRITYWPQAVLGLAFNWGALMGYAAASGHVSAAAIALYLGAIGWTIGYDTIYAHQDKEDDALIGVKSTALRFGTSTKSWLAFFYSLMIAGLVLTGVLAGLGLVYYVGIVLAAAHLVWQARRLDIDDAGLCLQIFRSNRDFGAIVFASLLLGQFF
jgi:4-hydroxybenzoate polyprenyltransferase